MQMDVDGQKWMDVEESGCRWTQVDKIGCMWMKVDAGGPEYDVRVQRIPGTGFFSSILLVVSEPVLEKKWYRTKSCNRYPKKLVPEKFSEPTLENLVPEKSIGAGIGKIWYRS